MKNPCVNVFQATHLGMSQVADAFTLSTDEGATAVAQDKTLGPFSEQWAQQRRDKFAVLNTGAGTVKDTQK